MTDFTPAWFIRNPHAQTIWGRLARARKLVRFLRETLVTPDGDELVLDHLDSPVTAEHPMHFVVLHGLEGSSYSVYVQGMLAAVARHGHRGTAINFRSCARDPQHLSRSIPNRRPRFYHSGETGDFDFVLRTLASRAPGTPFAAIGTSLGGNALLKWLGEHPELPHVRAAAAMSVPLDLGAGATYLEQGLGPLYVGSFLRTLKPKVQRVMRDFPELAQQLRLERSLGAKTFREFDDFATAPLHGFQDANDYYTRSSSIHFIDRIQVPTLILNAEDDPFLPLEALQRARSIASPRVEFRTTPCGGHAGFIAGRVPWRCDYWAEETVVNWLVGHAGP